MSDVPDEIVAAWIALHRAQQRTVTSVERALKQAGLPPLTWYDALLELDRAAEGLRPSALEKKMLLPQHGISRLLSRLEHQGLVERATVKDDGRGQVFHITQHGRQLRRNMWPVYARALESTLGSKLDHADAVKIKKLLDRL